MTPDAFADFMASLQNRTKKLDPYRSEILTWLKEHPDVTSAQIYDWLQDKFDVQSVAEKAICLTGSEQAELFYDNTRFRRSDAAPARVEKTLLGQGGIQGLDGDVHKNRKAMFMSLMDSKAMDEIEALTQKYWHEFFEGETSDDTVELYEAAKVVFLQVASDWVGISLQDENIKARHSRFLIYTNHPQRSVFSIGKGVNQGLTQRTGFRGVLKMCGMVRLKLTKREHCISSPCIEI